MFRSLGIEIGDLFAIWCLKFGILCTLSLLALGDMIDLLEKTYAAGV